MNENSRSYEAMFLLDSGGSDFQANSEPVRNILARSEAEVLAVKPWEERKLAYEIQGRKRGLYILTYFKANPLKVKDIEHDCQLDERILRVLVTRVDRLTQEIIDAETPATATPRPVAEVPAEAQPAAAAVAEAIPGEDVPDVLEEEK